MLTVSDIIQRYKNYGKCIDGLMLQEIQMLPEEELLDIIIEAQGRNIVIDYPKEDMLDGLWYRYDGEIDPDFDILNEEK